jgi:exodeoxyribonuclease-5
MDFIANGDVAIVRRVRHEREMHGFRFADISLRFPDYEDLEVEGTVILDTLISEAPALTHEQQEMLFQRVWDDYPELTAKRDRMKAVKDDPYFNALQIKYAYAITCHKAQGGQWQRVFIDQGYMTEDMLSSDYFRWLYTALTRATERVYLVNWPKQELDEESQSMEY